MYLKLSGKEYSAQLYNAMHYILDKVPGEGEAFSIRDDKSFSFFFRDGTVEQLNKLLLAGFTAELVPHIEGVSVQEEHGFGYRINDREALDQADESGKFPIVPRKKSK